MNVSGIAQGPPLKGELATGEAPTLQERTTDELVIALVGPVGSGVSKTAALLIEILKIRFGYEANYVKASDIIRDLSSKAGTLAGKGGDRISYLQKAGDALRETYGNSYIAKKCIEKIGVGRLESGGYEKIEATLVVKPRRVAHIVDSLKHPDEVRAFREVYGDTFWLFGVFAPEEVRAARMRHDGVDATKVHLLMAVDEEEGIEHGQKVRDTIHQSDFFIRNDGENDVRLKKSINRYLDIIFNIGVNTPSQDEAGMYKAMSAAASSACLSRQVGAVIYNHSGELIGIGANDVPKRGGGLYSEDDGDDDHRCYKWAGKICHNDKHKDSLYARVYEELGKSGVLTEGTSSEKITIALKKTEIKNLIEYSRAVHAEVEAILSVARGHNGGIVGATMYSTTYPCHNCASLIVASGIGRVMYIEPYAKSLALTLHSDAISIKENEHGSRVVFLQYEGVAPKNIIKLFNHGQPRKKDGRLLEVDPIICTPVFRAPLDGFSVREQIIITQISQLESKTRSESEVRNGQS